MDKEADKPNFWTYTAVEYSMARITNSIVNTDDQFPRTDLGQQLNEGD